MGIPSSYTNSRIFLRVVSCCAAEEGTICHVLDYFQERNEVALGIFKSKLQWNCLNFEKIPPFPAGTNHVNTSKGYSIYTDICFIKQQVHTLHNIAIHTKSYHLILKTAIWKFSVLFFTYFRITGDISLCQLQRWECWGIHSTYTLPRLTQKEYLTIFQLLTYPLYIRNGLPRWKV